MYKICQKKEFSCITDIKTIRKKVDYYMISSVVY